MRRSKIAKLIRKQDNLRSRKVLAPTSRSQTREGLSYWVGHELGVREGVLKGNLIFSVLRKAGG